VPRDMIEEALSRTGRLWGRLKAVRRMLGSIRERLGLSAKLLLLTLLFVMLAEVLIFVPSVANFRISWLSDRLTAARLAALATQDRGEGRVPDPLRTKLLKTAQVHAVSWLRNDQHTCGTNPDMRQVGRPCAVKDPLDYPDRIRAHEYRRKTKQ